MTGRATVTLSFNGEPLRWKGGNVEDLLRSQRIDAARRGVAVALNGEVLSRQEWDKKQLADGDRIEVVGMYKGG